MHGSWRCPGGADAARAASLLRAGHAPGHPAVRVRAGTGPRLGRRHGHRPGHDLPAAVPAASPGPGRHHVAGVHGGPAAPLLPAHRGRPDGARRLHPRLDPAQGQRRHPPGRKREGQAMRDDQLAADYLKRLRRAARTMPRAPRRELLEQIAAHIAEARAGAAPLRGVLDELGEPEDIAATGRASGRLGGSEIAAVVLLLIGGFIFLVGWFVGLVLLWASPRWRWPDKLLGTLVWPGGLAGVAFVGVYGTSSSSGVACVVSDGGRNSVCVSHGGGVR